MTARSDKPLAEHTAEPWEAERSVDQMGFETGKVWIIMKGQPCAYDFDRFEDADRAAQCVNACAGIADPAALRASHDALVEALERIERGAAEHLKPGMKGYITREGIRGIIRNVRDKHRQALATAKELSA